VQDPSNEEDNVGQVLFTDSVKFYGCNTNWATFTASADGSFHVDSDWASTRMACEGDRDAEIVALFTASTTFTLASDHGTQVTLFNAAGEKTLYLTWNEDKEESVVSEEVPID
jgi:heat shock protein HslJ